MALAALIGLAHLLFFDHPGGIAVVVWAWAIFAARLFTRPGPLPDRRTLGQAAAVLALTSLPVIEYHQGLSVFILLIGLATALAWLDIEPGGTGAGALTRGGKSFARMPWQAPADAFAAARHAFLAERDGGWGERLNAWLLPLIGVALLVALLAQANPILARWFEGLTEIEIDRHEWTWRLLFWTGTALMLWPLLSPRSPRERQTPSRTAEALAAPLVPGQKSLLRALVLFNATLAVQLGLDLSVLTHGAPEGIALSTYARQGAYPLLVVTLLGGGFAILAQLSPAHPWTRPLLTLWLVQNLVLCAAAFVRLQAYIDGFGLTYLRIYAGIWMGLVALGLALTLWQLWRGARLGWLLRRLVLICALTIYGSAFVNFSAVIADRNMQTPPEFRDRDYLRYGLPDTANAALLARCDMIEECRSIARSQDRIDDWRDWGFRRWRVNRQVWAWLMENTR
ncbi:MAG: DUF4173 domain-containing protein [Pseudomonadota bacterium]